MFFFKKISILPLFLISFFYIKCEKKHNYDLTLIGIAAYGDGISAINTGFADILHNDLKINSPWPTPFLKDMPKHLKAIFSNIDPTPGNVLIYNNVLYVHPNKKKMDLPNSKIKIAYSMVEGHGVPPEWVQALNSSFDAVVVPDDFLVDVYKKSGVNIPIFLLPICLPLENLLKAEISINHHKPFTFGISGAFTFRKNQKTVLEAFVKNFGNNPDFQLKIHGRMFETTDVTLKGLKEYIKDNKINNVIIDEQNFSRREYINFLKTIDCYVFLTRGEGFSITPREALALGIPCILSNNTAHETICKTGYVKSIPSNEVYDVDLNDACIALKDVWNNYKHYKTLALQARQWAAQYTAQNLHDKYLNLVKPKKIIFGQTNEITNDYLQTNSLNLFRKYKSLNILNNKN